MPTAGQILLNSVLPKDLRDYNRVFDKKTLNNVLGEVAKRYPKEYPKIVFDLKTMGQKSAYYNGSSFTLDDFRTPINKKKILEDAEKRISKRIIGIEDKNKQEDIFVEEYIKARDEIQDKVFKESLKKGNSLAHMVASGSRGNSNQLNSTIGAPVLYKDHLNRPILSPVKNSFSEGLSVKEYIASAPGTRAGAVSTQFATPIGGFFNKQVGYVSNNIIVSEDDCGTTNGYSDEALDPQNVGRFLAKSAGGFPAGTLIDQKVMSQFKRNRVKEVVLRSPMTCESDRGTCAKCRGHNENGQMPSLGDNVGVVSATAMSEPFTQGAMKEKHTGGTIGKISKASGLELIQQVLKIPKVFKQGAAISDIDGKVTEVKEAPQGGTNIFVDGKAHYVPKGFKPYVKIGDRVEEGQILSDGIVNPKKVTAKRGIGEGRLALFNSLREAYREDGKRVDKVHMETLARGMVNNVRVNDITGIEGNVPGEIITYSSAMKKYSPSSVQKVNIDSAKDKVLAKPYMHYTLGTRLKPSMLKNLKSQGIREVEVANAPMPFEPHMVRLDDVPSYRDNWVARLFSDKIKNKILASVYKGEEAPIHSEEFMPAYIAAKDFGKRMVDY